MNRANFMGHMAPTNLHGRDLQSTDQAALAIRMKHQAERRERQKSNIGYAGMAGPVGSFAEHMRDHQILDRAEKRAHRGGMTMRPEDGVTNQFPPTVRDGVRER